MHSVPPARIEVLVGLAVIFNVLGNFFLGLGMQEFGRVVSFSPLPYLAAFLNPWVGAGIAMMALWMIFQLSLLSRADLSFVLPVTSLTYVLTPIMSRIFLDEHVSVIRWAGIFLICLGVSAVGRTTPRTTPASVHPPAVVYPLGDDVEDEMAPGDCDRDREHSQ
jgi:drug/metabolite transporter (DMT)-like permease